MQYPPGCRSFTGSCDRLSGNDTAGRRRVDGFRVNDRRSSASEIVPRDTRDPQAATQSMQWVSPVMPMIPRWDALTAVNRAYFANVYVWRCVKVTTDAIANMPLRVGADPNKPNDYS